MSASNAADSAISADYYPLRRVFCSENRFVTPAFQRPYAWQPENALQLLEDMTTGSLEGGQYFLNNLVISREGDICYVIDGIQRLVTLTIILSALRDLTENKVHKDHYQQYVFQEGNELEDIPGHYRVQLHGDDGAFLQRAVQKIGAISALTTVDATHPATDGQTNIARNAVAVQQSLVGRSQESLWQLGKYLVKQCYLVIISTNDLGQSIKIFSTVNARGIPLTYHDILKAHFAAQLPRANWPLFSATWEHWEGTLRRDAFSRLFHSMALMVACGEDATAAASAAASGGTSHGQRRYKSSGEPPNPLEFYQRHAFPTNAFMQDLLVPCAQAALTLSGAAPLSNFSGTCDSRTHQHMSLLLSFLPMTGSDEYLSLTMAAIALTAHPHLLTYTGTPLTPANLLALLYAIERLSACFLLLRVSLPIQRRRYNHALGVLMAGQGPNAAIHELQLTADEAARVIDVLEGEVYSSGARRARYLLLRIDAAMSEAGQQGYVEGPMRENVTVEHILPQNIGPKSSWKKVWPDANLRAASVSRLGNLAPLSGKKNGRAGNQPWLTKKELYFFADNKSTPFVITNELRTIDEWTPEVFAARQERLLNIICTEWKLNLKTHRAVRANAAAAATAAAAAASAAAIPTASSASSSGTDPSSPGAVGLAGVAAEAEDTDSDEDSDSDLHVGPQTAV